MADNYLMLDGKKYELSSELVNALRSIDPAPEKKKPFLRERGKRIWYIGSKGAVVEDKDMSTGTDDLHYAVANYCTDKALMEQRAMHETLNRLLWRFSEEHGGDNPWDGINKHWFILMEDGNMKKNYFCSSKISGAIYFKDNETALSAIEEIVRPFLAAHPDFVW